MEPKRLILNEYQPIQAHGVACTLGFGAYGCVQLGISKSTGQKVAIKRIGRKIAMSEVQIHIKLNHPNIIKMIAYQFDQKQQCTYIILQYAQNGSLFQLIRDKGQKGIKDKKLIKYIFKKVCLAIEYLHQRKIMHRDIKPQNILLDKKNNVKVCDFGFATHCEPRTTICGTVQYMAPEMIHRKKYTHKIDIWGLGILLFQLIQGKAPFDGKTQEEVLSKMRKQLFFSKNFTKDQMELLHNILKVNPDQRPQIKQILQSPFLQDKNPGKKTSYPPVPPTIQHVNPFNQRYSDQSTRRQTLATSSTYDQLWMLDKHDQKWQKVEKQMDQRWPQKDTKQKIKIVEIKTINNQKEQKGQKKGIQILNIKYIEPQEVVHKSKNLPKQKHEKMSGNLNTNSNINSAKNLNLFSNSSISSISVVTSNSGSANDKISLKGR